MPLFRRHDGDLVRSEPPMRRIMPYLMRQRNSSIVFHDSVYRIHGTRLWLKAYNRTHPEHATLFHLFAYACALALHQRRELNRFVSGNRVYQRKGVQIAFVVKKELKDQGGHATLKLEMPQDESFPAFVARVTTSVEEGRTTERSVDHETALIMKLPGPAVSMLVALARLLDAWNLYPRVMTANDPLYASLFLANLGSVGISDAFHHLYEYGTVSIFCTLSAARRMVFAEGDTPVVAEGLGARWSFDERIHDAFYAARSLAVVQRVMEHPERFLGPPEGPAQPLRSA